jgi:hypothetical protein
MIVNLSWIVFDRSEHELAETVSDLWEDGNFHVETWLVYAPTPEIAACIAWLRWASSPPEDRWQVPGAIRYRGADHFAILEARPTQELRCRVFRELGWRFDDERHDCESCGLYPFGLPEYDVRETMEGYYVCLACKTDEEEFASEE